MRAMSARSWALLPILLVWASAGALPAQSAVEPAPDPAADLVQRAQQKQHDGKLEEAIPLFKQAVQMSPRYFLAHQHFGIILDLTGDYAGARTHLFMAQRLATTPRQKAQAQRAVAISYAFEGNCAETAKYEGPLFESYLEVKDFYDAGEIADEIARIFSECGRLDDAMTWYRTGRETGLRDPDIKADQRDLWDFRWEHAQARIAARRGNRAEAQKHIDAAKAILDKGTNSDQAPFFAYLTGYVAFHTGDFKAAIADLQKASQTDPFILSLIAQSYEKLGDQTQAVEYYKRVLAAPATHNPPNAFARPLAKKKLG
jgi:tetratricopeptide (TPR) repeat protein